MKKLLALLAALCPLVVASSLRAQLTDVDPSYSASPYFTHMNSDSIVSFDWGSDGNVYYETATSSFAFGGLYQDSSGTAAAVVPGSSSLFSGASVVSIGQYVYYNASDSSGNDDIFKYGAVGSNAANVLASQTTNFSLAQNGGRLFITGSTDFTSNQIYYSPVGAGGAIASSATSLGMQPGASGAIAFDPAGNMYYASGTGFNIYKFTAAEVAAAIANPATMQLNASGHLWLSYGAQFSNYAGATSMLIDPKGNLLLTVTDFGSQSALAKFGVAADGTYSGSESTLFQDNDGYGELRLRNGVVYLSVGNEIFAIVPEPSPAWLALAGVGVVAVLVRRRRAVA